METTCDNCQSLEERLAEAREEIQTLEEQNGDLEDEVNGLEIRVEELEELVPDPMAGEDDMAQSELEKKVDALLDLVDGLDLFEKEWCSDERVRRIVEDLRDIQRAKWNRTYSESVRAYKAQEGRPQAV